MAGGKAMGRRGGQKTRDTHAPDYYQTIGAMGGKQTARVRAASGEADALFDEDGNRRPPEDIPFLPEDDE